MLVQLHRAPANEIQSQIILKDLDSRVNSSLYLDSVLFSELFGILQLVFVCLFGVGNGY